MYGAVPLPAVNVIGAAGVPAQIVAPPEMTAVGNGFTVIVPEPEAEFVQFASLTDTRL